MEGGGRLFSRLFGRLREHKLNTMRKRQSFTSTVYRVSVSQSTNEMSSSHVPSVSESTSSDEEPNEPSTFDNNPLEDTFTANIDLRYGGQCLTAEQLPAFCDQLHHLVEVIRNVQSYAKVTGEYPSELERRLEQEAREVAALAAEARNAREVVTRAKAQRRAVKAHKKHLVKHLATLKETEFRELENTVRLSDRKLFKSWESLKNSVDPAAFDTLLDEVTNKQAALECLLRLVDNKRSALSRQTLRPSPTPLPPPEPRDNDGESAPVSRKRLDGLKRSGAKRRRREPRSEPLSEEPSRHGPPLPQVTLYIQGTENSSRYRVGSAGAVAITPLELPSGGSVRDIMFFTTN